MKNTLAKNLSWILICSVVGKIIGGIYRIVLTRILGSDIGLYQMVFTAYSFMVVLISSGVPLTVSKFIAGAKTESKQRKILYGTIAILLTISGILAIILLFGSKGLALIQGESKLSICYIILAPSLIFSALSAVLRGYQQGKKNFTIPALAGVCEQMVRVVAGLALMLTLRKFFVLGALLGAMLGTLIGDIVAFVFLKLCYKPQIKLEYSFKNIRDGKSVFKYGYQIMLYSLIIPLSNFIDSFLVVRLLSVQLPINTATLLYGLQTGAVGCIVSIPSIFSFSLISVLMPRLSNDYANKKMFEFNKKTLLAFKLVLCVALPCAVFFAINSGNIINLLYGTNINGFGVNGQYVAKNLLIISSVSVVFASINQLTAIILQNLNKKSVPIINLCIGIGCKLLVELMFVPSKGLGIYAYAIAIVIAYIVSATLNLYAVEQSGVKIIDITSLTKQFGLSVVVLGLLTIFRLFTSTYVFVLGTIFTIIIYMVGIYLIKLFSKEDIKIIINSE